MKELTVKQLAVISGVTVRTLHHYDEIGLLKPASVGVNGYRYYGHQELLRLQRILFHRELGVPLGTISELLELEGDNQIEILKQHREKLQAERARYKALIDTIDRTIQQLQGKVPMANADLYRGFSPEKQAGYETWLVARYGEPMRRGISRAQRSGTRLSCAERTSLNEELRNIETALADALRKEVDPESEAVERLITRHRAWISTMWGHPCSARMHSGLADLYLAHPDFVDRYERIEKGFAEYLARAIKFHAKASE